MRILSCFQFAPGRCQSLEHAFKWKRPLIEPFSGLKFSVKV